MTNHFFSYQKNLFLIIISSLFSFSLPAQNDPEKFWDHVGIGGGIGISFGDGFFSGTLAPSAIYRFNQKVALGVGLNGTYSSWKNYHKSTILGGSILGLINPIPELQLSAEFEELNVSRNWDSRLLIADENYWYPALFLGAGYRIINGRVSTAIGIRYDVLYDRNKSIYAEAWMPFLRVYL